MRRFLPWLCLASCLAFFLVGCSDRRGGPRAGGDAGRVVDAGADAGSDAGRVVDAGADAGTTADGGGDAGSDAGVDPQRDSGVDAGTGRDAGGGADWTHVGTLELGPEQRSSLLSDSVPESLTAAGYLRLVSTCRLETIEARPQHWTGSELVDVPITRIVSSPTAPVYRIADGRGMPTLNSFVVRVSWASGPGMPCTVDVELARTLP